MNILYSTDENYVQHLMASIVSLLENNKKEKNLFIYIIDNEISENSKKCINDLSNIYGNVKFYFVPLKQICEKFEKKDSYPISSYARLFFSKHCTCNKILYIDCDTIINSSLRKLYDTDISNYYVAGVQDNPAYYMIKSIGMNKDDRYINAGVLLINLSKWRKDKLDEKFLEFVTIYNGKVPHHDQGIINGVCKGKILIIEPKYNSMSQFFQFNANQIKKLYGIKKYYTNKEVEEAKNNPVIIHYISKFYNRPWFDDCIHPKKELYFDALNNVNYNIKIYKSNFSRKVKIRRYIYKHFPFCIYYIFEKMLDFKRIIKFYTKKL